jgi:hypothetical protein
VEVQSVRAKVIIGSDEFKTPFVKAFSVTRQRGTLWASASITLELPSGSPSDIVADSIKIYAIVDGDSKLLFTGYVDTVDITPSMSKYGGTLLNMTAYDKLYKLKLLKVTRRIQVSPGDVWCSITGISRKAGKSTSSRFEPRKYKIRTVIGDSTSGDPNYDPLTKEAKDKLSTAEKRANNIPGLTNETAPGGLHSGSEIPAHAHSDWKHGGPAVGVFGDYTLYEEEE